MAIGDRALSRLAAATAGVAALAVFVWTSAPDLLPGDSGEFQFAVPLLGIVHPTGYPLYLLLAKAFTILPFGSVAYRVNLFSAASAALAVAFFCALLERSMWNRVPRASVRRALALAGAMTLAFTPTFWAQATRAEVYALHTLLFVVLLWTALEGALPAERRGGNADTETHAETAAGNIWPLLALLFGLSLAHHRTTLLLLPALTVGMWGSHVSSRDRWLAPFMLVVPLLLYLYTPLRYDASPYTRIALDETHVVTTLERTPQAFAVHMLGSNFGGSLRWDESAAERLIGLPERIVAEFGGAIAGWAALATTAAGFALMALSNRTRRLAVMIVTSFGAFVAFNTLYQIGDIADYYTPVYALLIWAIIWAAGALATLGSTRSASLAIIVAWAVPAWLLLAHGGNVSSDTGTRALATSLLDGAPSSAILISNDRDDMTPLFYLQLVEGKRNDVAPLFPRITPTLDHVVPLTRYALETGRPVFFIKEMLGLETVFETVRQGGLTRVTGGALMKPSYPLGGESASARLRAWAARYQAGHAEVTLYWQAAGANRGDFSTYVHLLDASGALVSQNDHVPGGVYYPPSQWRADEEIRDVHRLDWPDTAPPVLRIVAGAYGSDGVTGVRRLEAGTIRRSD